ATPQGCPPASFFRGRPGRGHRLRGEILDHSSGGVVRVNGFILGHASAAVHNPMAAQRVLHVLLPESLTSVDLVARESEVEFTDAIVGKVIGARHPLLYPLS